MNRSKDVRRQIAEAEHGQYESDDAIALSQYFFRNNIRPTRLRSRDNAERWVRQQVRTIGQQVLLDNDIISLDDNDYDIVAGLVWNAYKDHMWWDQYGHDSWTTSTGETLGFTEGEATWLASEFLRAVEIPEYASREDIQNLIHESPHILRIPLRRTGLRRRLDRDEVRYLAQEVIRQRNVQ